MASDQPDGEIAFPAVAHGPGRACLCPDRLAADSDGLPLRLNAFERYMWADDRAAHPMSYFVQLAYSGRLDEPTFGEALERTLQRHPLLHARIAGQRNQDLTWVASPDLRPYFDCADTSKPMRFPSRYRIDLREENGLRIWVRRSAAGGVIRMQFHHACCDGIAANQFLDELLRAYDHLARRAIDDPAAAALPAVDFRGLRRRNRFGANWWDWIGRRMVDLWGLALGPAIFLLVRPAPLQSRDACDDPAPPGDVVPDLVTWRFTRPQFASLLARARASRATLNDLLLRDVFLSIHAWNLDHDPRLRHELIRIMVPFNLRGPEHRNLPAVNVVGMANLDRRFRWPWYRNRWWLLRGIQLETTFLKRFRIVTCFPSIMWVLGGLPGGLHRFLGPGRCLATCVVSNLGRIFVDSPLRQGDGKLVAGELIVDAVDTAPPVRCGSGVALTFYTYAGQLSVSLNYDLCRLRRPTAEQLLRHLVAQIERTADLPGGAES